MRIRIQLALALGAVIAIALLAEPLSKAATSKIHAERGRKYTITKRHGPWMIMVAAIGDVPADSLRHIDGLSAQEAADELVYELRLKGIPAYTFSQDEIEQAVDTYDRQGRTARRKIIAQQGQVAVLAGNYPDPEDRYAKKTLNFIKKYHPKVIRNEKNGASYAPTPGQPGPLSGAFLISNPMLSPAELETRRRDPLLLKLNSGTEYSLLENPGKYTLVVASFYGQSITGPSNDAKFRMLAQKSIVNDALDQAAVNSWELAKTLRDGHQLKLHQGFEAYVFHDRHRSIVTVGSFDSPNDPQIKELAELFRAKVKQNLQTGRDVLVSEMVVVPGNDPNRTPARTWIFDPVPQLIEVPKLN